MKNEYKIEWKVPAGFDPSEMLRKLPSPIGKQMKEIYNYSVEGYGFRFIENHIDKLVSANALGIMVDEALRHATEVRITKK